jgi:hypothetical protein
VLLAVYLLVEWLQPMRSPEREPTAPARDR